MWSSNITHGLLTVDFPERVMGGWVNFVVDFLPVKPRISCYFSGFPCIRSYFPSDKYFLSTRKSYPITSSLPEPDIYFCGKTIPLPPFYSWTFSLPPSREIGSKTMYGQVHFALFPLVSFSNFPFFSPICSSLTILFYFPLFISQLT